MRIKVPRCTILIALAALMALVWPAGVRAASAQINAGEIFGRVTDANRSPMVGVAVTVEGPSLLRPMSAVTSTSGTYSIVRVPIGTYRVTFTLTNCKTYVRTGVRITAGFNAEIDAAMDVSERQEVMTVTAATPIVDTKSVATGMAFERDTLDAIPTARDPWEVLNLSPGVVMGRVNVGGSSSGQQPLFAAYGQSQAQAMWNLDGATITDMASLLSPQFYDFDAFAEILIATGGSDASVQTSDRASGSGGRMEAPAFSSSRALLVTSIHVLLSSARGSSSSVSMSATWRLCSAARPRTIGGRSR
jgi:hypothetical protein